MQYGSFNYDLQYVIIKDSKFGLKFTFPYIDIL